MNIAAILIPHNSLTCQLPLTNNSLTKSITKSSLLPSQGFDRCHSSLYNVPMKEWTLSQSDPLHLNLAADARLGAPDYLNDHIWEVKLNGGTPPGVGVQTTFGLRARLMRLFPRFQRKDAWISDPEQFYKPPVVTRFYPNFLALKYAPYSGVDVIAEYWVPSSQVLAGRLTFANPSVLRESFIFEWIELLNHLGDGQGVAVTETGIIRILEGKTSELWPVCIMTGGPRAGSGPYAGLAFDIDLKPGDSRQFTWALAALDSPQASLELARLTTARPWDAEIARIELVEESQSISILTGNPDWDAALALSVRAANGLFFPASTYLPYQSFVLTRQPENGYSVRPDGKGYNHLWNGQTVLDACYLYSVVGPGQADRLAGVVENFIASQTKTGAIDWKPGLAGQRARRLAQPMLANLAWKIHVERDDRDWIQKIYPILMDFLRCWFLPSSDRDQDGFPEWAHPFQLGLDEIPLFHPWAEEAQGVDPEAVESPSLAAMLYAECDALIKMAELLGHDDDAAWLLDRRETLRTELARNWSENRKSYSYRDAVIQDSPAGQSLLEITSSGTYPVRESFSSPRRLLLRFHPLDEMTRQIQLSLYGETPDGPESEEIHPRDIHWLHGAGRYTTTHHFTRLIEVTARDFQPGDRCEIGTIDFTSEDISLLLPLWAGIPDEEQAKAIVEGPVLSRYLQAHGLTVCPADRCPPGSTFCGVHLPWNQFIIEGMLKYGYRSEAAQITTILMNTVSASLKTTQSFWSAYHGETGHGLGERNTLNGLAPVGLFLRVLGLQKISPNQIIVDGLNPFSRPVTVQYRGTKLEFYSDRTQVTFAGGQSAVIQDSGLHDITLP